MPLYGADSFLGWMDNWRRVAAKNVRDLVKDPSNALSKTLHASVDTIDQTMRDPMNFVGAGILKGPLAKTWDIKAAKKAEELLLTSIPKEVWEKTGTFRSPGDSLLRQEIPDVDASLIGDIHKKTRRLLPEVLNHPKLFEAYPELTKVEVVTGPQVKGGSFNKGSGGSPSIIGLGTNDTFFPLERLMHEVQHAVQEIEGFQPGANTFIVKSLPEYKKGLGKVIEKQALKDSNNWTTVDSSDLDTTLQLLANSIYRRTAGEAEARAVASRTFESKASLRRTIPTMSYDIPISSLIKQEIK